MPERHPTLLQQSNYGPGAGPLGGAAENVGPMEGARDSQGRWLHVHNGIIFNYQVVSSSIWDCSPRDAARAPGALEQAMAGSLVRGGEITPVTAQYTVGSFDPCIACTIR
jgi:Ni,Fe-hydrogenase I large subunit